ncbi:GntR family transcriptional regulator [Frondihabitans cladoniiphilus]|uniref:HTH gntR-type domain-containing protein n=1 Tax=Frondihabitans cladoniiphilus TaxID=715785 RepID=A0ABP8W1M3_9MICO
MPVPDRLDEPVPARRLLTDDVFDRLQDDIVRGRLAPGQRLYDLSLASELGLSRATVRTALLRLKEVKLVEAVPNLYTRVAPLDLVRYLETQDTARALYLFAARMGTPFLTDEQISGFRAYGDDAAERVEVDADNLFSGRAEAAALLPFVDALGNAALARAVQRLSPTIRRMTGLHADLIPCDGIFDTIRSLSAAAGRRDAEGVTAALNAYYDGPIAEFHERLGDLFDETGPVHP